MARLHIQHLKADIDQFLQSTSSVMVDKQALQQEMVDKWSIKPSLAEKLVDILVFVADKDEITTDSAAQHHCDDRRGAPRTVWHGREGGPGRQRAHRDDQEVRNRIFDRLHINPDTTNAELQKEVLEEYGMRYPDMTINEWRHLIEDYTPMVKDAIKSRDEAAKTIPLSFDKAAEDLRIIKDETEKGE